MSETLVLDGLQFAYGPHRVLRGVYLEVARGRICGLVGRNGCGKTTAVRAAAGVLRTDAGIVTIGDDRFHKPSRRRRFDHIAYLPQESMLPPGLRVRELGQLTRLEVDPKLEPQRVRELSTGERKLLELRIVLGLGRRYCLLDEPFTGIAPLYIEKMVQEIRAASASGVGLLITDHYHQYVTKIADYAYLMENGQCRRLEPPLAESLVALGYLPSRKGAELT